MRIVVTGATGFIGRRLVRQLRDRGEDVVAVVRDPTRAMDLHGVGVELVEGDVTRPDSMRPAFEGADALMHLAAWYEVGVDDVSAMERINVQGTRNVLELMQEFDLDRGVYTSTLAVFSDTGGRLVDERYRHDPANGFLSSYDRTKWQAHYEVAVPMIERGLPLVIVQPGTVYGPGDPSQLGDTMRAYLRRELPVLVRGVAFAWGHVDDIAHAHVLALDRGVPGESYIICGPAHELEAVIDLAETLTGIPAPRLRVPGWLMRQASRMAGPIHRMIPLRGQAHPETLRVVGGVTYLGDNAKAKRELDYAPRSLEDGLPSVLAHEMRALGMHVPDRLQPAD